MSEISDTELRRILLEAETAARQGGPRAHPGLIGLASQLRRLADGEDDPVRGIIAALDYHLTFDNDARERHGPFGPMMEGPGWASPAYLADIDTMVPGTFHLWRRAVGCTTVPAVRARLADLLWEARFGDRPHEHAQVAIDAYLEAVEDDFEHPVRVGDGVRRAMELAAQINDEQRQTAAVTAGVELAMRAMAEEDPSPGVALRLLDVFVTDRPERRPDALAQLLDLAEGRFGNDAWHLETITELRSRLVQPEDRPALWTKAAKAFRELARSSNGLKRYAHLQHALELAEQHALSDLTDEIRREVESMGPDELDLQRVSAEVSIEREKVDQFIDWFVGDDSLEHALTRFGAYLTTQDLEANRAFVTEMMERHPLQFTVTRLHIGPENAPVTSPAAGDDPAEQALIQHEAQGASMFATFAVEILERITDRYGPISVAVEWFQGPAIDVALAEAFTRGTDLYARGDFDAAAHVLAPRLERAVRRLAGAAGVPVTRSPDRRGHSGGVKGLGRLLSELVGVLPEPTRRYLRVLLVDPIGLNLRNRVGHGLDEQYPRPVVALLIHAACHLALLGPGRATSSAS